MQVRTPSQVSTPTLCSPHIQRHPHSGTPTVSVTHTQHHLHSEFPKLNPPCTRTLRPPCPMASHSQDAAVPGEHPVKVRALPEISQVP